MTDQEIIDLALERKLDRYPRAKVSLFTVDPYQADFAEIDFTKSPPIVTRMKKYEP